MWLKPRIGTLLAFTALVAWGCGEQPRGGAPPQGAPSEATVFALLADNRLVEVSLPGGRVVSEQRLAPSPRHATAGRFLAMNADGNTLFVLVPSTGEVAVVDVRSSEVRERLPLPRGVVFGALMVGPRSGRLYVLGSRAGHVVKTEHGPLYERSAVIAVVDPGARRVVSSATIREAKRLDWSIYGAAVAPDERRIFVSYHGSSTSGVDWIDVANGDLERCRRKAPWHGGACAAKVHGAVEPYRDGLLGATGLEHIVDVGPNGAVRRRISTRLRDTHLMEFALDRERGRLYAAGSCYHGAGLSAIDLESGRARVLASSGAAAGGYGELPDACGDRIAVGPRALIVLARTTMAAASPGRPGKLVFVDGRSGRVVRQVETPAEPVDVLVAAPRAAKR